MICELVTCTFLFLSPMQTVKDVIIHYNVFERNRVKLPRPRRMFRIRTKSQNTAK